MNILFNAMTQMLLFVPLCVGIYITYRIMQITDLTVEGTFVLGAAIFARLLELHYPQAVAFTGAVVGGAAIGVLVALMQRYGKLDPLITSILAVFMLYSVNFEVMARPNISLLSADTLVQHLQMQSPLKLIVFLLLLSSILVYLLCLLMRSRMGLLLRVFGRNKYLLSVVSAKSLLLLVFGLLVSNALAACSGVLTAQVNGYADISMGLGVALTAIGSMVVGLTLVDKLRISMRAYSCVVEITASIFGVFVYFLLLNLLLFYGLNPILMKLVVGMLLFLFLACGAARSKEVAYVG